MYVCYEQREVGGALTSILLAYEEEASGAYMTTHAQQKGRDGWFHTGYKRSVWSLWMGRLGWLFCVCGPDSFVEENPKKERTKESTPSPLK